MLISNLKLSIRHLFRKPLSSFINIGGLTIGLTTTLLILKFAAFELSYDTFHPKADRLYRVTTVNLNGETAIYKDAMSFNRVGPLLKEEFGEVEEFARAFDLSFGINVRSGEDLYRETEALVADPSFLDLMNYPMIEGNPESALDKPFSIVLTISQAKKYFGNQDPMNKILRVVGGQFDGAYQVTGVVEDPPSNGHLKFDMLISYDTFWQVGVEPNWSNFNDYTYILLAENANVEALQEKILPLSKQHLNESVD